MFGSKHQAAYVPRGSSGKIKFLLFGIGFGFIGGYIAAMPSPEGNAQRGSEAGTEANADKPSSSQFLYEFFDALPQKRLAPQRESAQPSSGIGGRGEAVAESEKTVDLKTLQEVLQKTLNKALAKSEQKPTALPLAKDLAQELASLLPKPAEQPSGKLFGEALAQSLEKSLAKALEKSLAKSPEKPRAQPLAKELALELAQLLPSLLPKQPAQQQEQTQQREQAQQREQTQQREQAQPLRQAVASPPPRSEIPPRQLPPLFGRNTPAAPSSVEGLVSLKPDLADDPSLGSDFDNDGSINSDFYGEPRRFRDGSRDDPYRASAAKTQYLVRVAVFDSPLEAKKMEKRLQREKLDAHMREIQIDGDWVYRVAIGPVNGGPELVRIRQQLEARNIDGFITYPYVEGHESYQDRY